MRKFAVWVAMAGLASGLLVAGQLPAQAIDWTGWQGGSVQNASASPEVVVFDSSESRTASLDIGISDDVPPAGITVEFVQALVYDPTSCDYYSYWQEDFRTEPYDFSKCDVWGSTTESTTVSDDPDRDPYRRFRFDITIPNRMASGSLSRFEGLNESSQAPTLIRILKTTGVPDGDGYIYERNHELAYAHVPSITEATRASLAGPASVRRGHSATFTGKAEKFEQAWVGGVNVSLDFKPDGGTWSWSGVDGVQSGADGGFSVTVPAVSRSGEWRVVAALYDQAPHDESESTSNEIRLTATGPSSLTATPIPTISGKARVHSKLTAHPGTWGPKPVTLAYRWRRNGTAIKGATRQTYTLTSKDKGRRITVTVTGSKPGYAAVAKTSAKTRAVKK